MSHENSWEIPECGKSCSTLNYCYFVPCSKSDVWVGSTKPCQLNDCYCYIFPQRKPRNRMWWQRRLAIAGLKEDTEHSKRFEFLQADKSLKTHENVFHLHAPGTGEDDWGELFISFSVPWWWLTIWTSGAEFLNCLQLQNLFIQCTRKRISKMVTWCEPYWSCKIDSLSKLFALDYWETFWRCWMVLTSNDMICFLMWWVLLQNLMASCQHRILITTCWPGLLHRNRQRKYSCKYGVYQQHFSRYSWLSGSICWLRV